MMGTATLPDRYVGTAGIEFTSFFMNGESKRQEMLAQPECTCICTCTCGFCPCSCDCTCTCNCSCNCNCDCKCDCGTCPCSCSCNCGNCNCTCDPCKCTCGDPILSTQLFGPVYQAPSVATRNNNLTPQQNGMRDSQDTNQRSATQTNIANGTRAQLDSQLYSSLYQSQYQPSYDSLRGDNWLAQSQSQQTNWTGTVNDSQRRSTSTGNSTSESDKVAAGGG